MFKETSHFKRLAPKNLPSFWNEIADQNPDRAQIWLLECSTLAKHDLIMNYLDSFQNCRMVQGIHRCPRTSFLSFFVIIFEGIENVLKKLIRSVLNSLNHPKKNILRNSSKLETSLFNSFSNP